MDKHEVEAVDQTAALASSGQYATNERKEQVTVLGTMGQDPDVKQKIPWKVWAVVGLCCLASFQNVFFGIAPASGAYSIAGALNGMDKRIWIVQAQSVPSIATGPIISIFADIYGRRYVVLGVWLLLCIAAIIAMTATSMNTLIAGQVLAGIGAGISGLSFAIASEVTPSIYRSHVQTAINAISGLAAVMALVGIGGISTIDPANGWRWIFRFLLIVDGIVFIGFALLYHPPPRTRSRESTIEKMKSMDWIGYTLLLGGLVPLLLGFAYSSDSNYGWHSAHAYVPVAVGFAGFAACLAWEWKGTSTGFLDHRLFMDGRNFPLAIFIIAVEGSLFYLVNNIYSGQVFGLWATQETAVQQGARLLPFFLVISVLSPFLSIYVTKYKDIKWPLCAGFLFFSAAVIGFAMAGTRANVGLVFNAIGGIGFAAPLILVMTLVQLSTPPLFIGTASALTISSRTLGGTVGYAMADAIFASKTNTQIPAAIAATALSMGFDPANLTQLIIAVLSHQGLDKVPGITGPIIGAVFGEVAKVNAHGYKITWFSFLPATIIAAIACAFLKNPKERMNWIVDAPLDTTKESDKIEGTESEGAADEKDSSQQLER